MFCYNTIQPKKAILHWIILEDETPNWLKNLALSTFN